MQTFLPYADFEKSMKCLDYRRLGKQRVEAKQLLDLLRRVQKITKDERYVSWSNHPAARMWQGYEDALASYTNEAIIEWVRRGYVNSMQLEKLPREKIVMPWWMGQKRFHSSHRSRLLAKEPTYYGQFGWKETPDQPYFWPVYGLRLGPILSKLHMEK